MICRLFARFRRPSRKFHYRDMTPTQKAAFDAAFDHMDRAFEELDKALREMPK